MIFVCKSLKAFLYGAGTGTVLIQSLAITAELIGKNTGSAAFVYGAMSLTGNIEKGWNWVNDFDR